MQGEWRCCVRTPFLLLVSDLGRTLVDHVIPLAITARRTRAGLMGCTAGAAFHSDLEEMLVRATHASLNACMSTSPYQLGRFPDSLRKEMYWPWLKLSPFPRNHSNNEFFE